MSDESDRPLTRRERRMREMGQSSPDTTVPDTDLRTEIPAAPVSAVPVFADQAAQVPGDPGDEIEISPFNDDGTPRSRREMRLLREQALAERGEAVAAKAAVQETVEEPAEEVAEEITPESDELLDLEETQPLSLEDLQELSRPETDEADATAPEGASEETEDGEDAFDELFGTDASDETEPEEIEPVDHAETAPVEAPVEPEASAEPENSTEAGFAEETGGGAAEPKRSYSFPDIAPLDDNISVFDDPAVRQAPLAETPVAAEGGDFDDLISRAVAQEGAGSTANTSALILPNLPDTGELSGPIGETGELFITGSIELPKSLGETGGHAPLHDSVEVDPLGELGFEDLDLEGMPTSGDAISPVSASRAVSAVSAGDAIVAQQTKEKSKLPLVLILTGGGLVVAVGALLIWGASAGMFG